MGDNQKAGLIKDRWLRIFIIITTIAFIFSFSACGVKEKNPDERGAGKVIEKAVDDTQKTVEVNSELKPNVGDVGNNLSLPDNYPKEILPIAGDANIIYVGQHPENNGLGISYVSEDDLDSLLELNKSALSDATNLMVMETDVGYMLMASLEGISYTIMIGEGIFDHNPEYKGKQGVHIELTGVKGLSDGGIEAEVPGDGGKPWPASDMIDVPELEGYISNAYTEDNVIRLEITVNDLDAIKNYIDQLENAGFTFDSQPDTSNDNIEFFAFRDSTILNFAYKAAENLVFIEYMKS